MKTKLVFLRRGGVGDFILAMPLLKACRERYDRVCLVTRRIFRDLVPPSCRPDAWLDCDAVLITALYTAGAVLPEKLQTVFRGADVIHFGSPDDVVSENLDRCGVRETHWIRSRPQGPGHAVCHFFRDAGLSAPPPDVLSRPLWERGAAPGAELWIHPGSGSPAKNVPLPVFAEFADAWQQKRGAGVVVSFGEADPGLVDETTAAFAARGIHYETVICPSLCELRTALQEKAYEYVGNDSGVSHLAGALGIPTTVFFRCTDPDVWRPLGICRIERWQP